MQGDYIPPNMFPNSPDYVLFEEEIPIDRYSYLNKISISFYILKNTPDVINTLK